MEYLGWIKNKVANIVDKHKTNCPYKLAESLNVHVILWNLHEEIDGVYQYTKRNKFLYINNNLDENSQRFICAHELGHAILHSKVSTPFMRSNTWFSVDRIEVEANTFAAELLISDDSLRICHNYTIEQIAALHNVPVELVELKCKGLF